MKKNNMKKGMSVVELIVSFTLTISIVVFLIQIISSLNKMYNNNSIKTEILNTSSIISNKINTSFRNKEIIYINSCGDNCYNFEYKDNTIEKLEIKDNTITFGTYTTKLKNGSFDNISLEIIYAPTLQSGALNAIFTLKIPIKSDINYNFDIDIVYRFNTANSNIDEYFTS